MRGEFLLEMLVKRGGGLCCDLSILGVKLFTKKMKLVLKLKKESKMESMVKMMMT